MPPRIDRSLGSARSAFSARIQRAGDKTVVVLLYIANYLVRKGDEVHRNNLRDFLYAETDGHDSGVIVGKSVAAGMNRRARWWCCCL